MGDENVRENLQIWMKALQRAYDEWPKNEPKHAATCPCFKCSFEQERDKSSKDHPWVPPEDWHKKEKPPSHVTVDGDTIKIKLSDDSHGHCFNWNDWHFATVNEVAPLPGPTDGPSNVIPAALESLDRVKLSVNELTWDEQHQIYEFLYEMGHRIR